MKSLEEKIEIYEDFLEAIVENEESNYYNCEECTKDRAIYLQGIKYVVNYYIFFDNLELRRKFQLLFLSFVFLY